MSLIQFWTFAFQSGESMVAGRTFGFAGNPEAMNPWYMWRREEPRKAYASS